MYFFKIFRITPAASYPFCLFTLISTLIPVRLHVAFNIGTLALINLIFLLKPLFFNIFIIYINSLISIFLEESISSLRIAKSRSEKTVEVFWLKDPKRTTRQLGLYFCIIFLRHCIVRWRWERLESLGIIYFTYSIISSLNLSSIFSIFFVSFVIHSGLSFSFSFSFLLLTIALNIKGFLLLLSSLLYIILLLKFH